ncbi:hypothetical protein BSK54_10265 [Paenibacillus odorifer]|uniref:hypothetical protein n=1 Tax=Paenibacillus odorifer TaxID=189426 RepID=UPI00097AACD1|nr:hypothetical protein [Paenibacillus odorifer]OME02634.1 hypothetical protein BSK54_10265 [Paenibacillus odorifer]
MGFDSKHRDPEVESLLDALPEEEKTIYRFMREAYVELTNDGNDYNVEVQDEEVVRMASDKFGIAEERAAQIYEEVEFRVSKFQQARLHNGI